MTRESLEWTDGGWTYRVCEEGRLFRFRAHYSTPPPGKPLDLDLGLIPGGIYAAFKNVVTRAGRTTG